MIADIRTRTEVPLSNATNQTDVNPWQWPEETWRYHAGKIRAGRKLGPTAWPNGARCAVALSFDPDHETIAMRDGDTGVGVLARGEFGSRRGSVRLLELLERHRIPATFFMPAVSALLHPQEIASYASAGHEIGAHGWIHERNLLLPPADERDLAFRALDVLKSLSGQRPIGIRTPSADFSDATLDIIIESGLIYDSSLMADDDPYELVANGRPTGIVELPMEWIRDDAPYFNMDRYGSARPYMAPRDWIQIQIDEFDGAYRDGGVYQLTCHPHIIGYRSRISPMDEFCAYMAKHSDVWFATHGQIASFLAEEFNVVPDSAAKNLEAT